MIRINLLTEAKAAAACDTVMGPSAARFAAFIFEGSNNGLAIEGQRSAALRIAPLRSATLRDWASQNHFAASAPEGWPDISTTRTATSAERASGCEGESTRTCIRFRNRVTSGAT